MWSPTTDNEMRHRENTQRQRQTYHAFKAAHGVWLQKNDLGSACSHIRQTNTNRRTHTHKHTHTHTHTHLSCPIASHGKCQIAQYRQRITRFWSRRDRCDRRRRGNVERRETDRQTDIHSQAHTHTQTQDRQRERETNRSANS